uniref:Uncharacterized protein n=1 Tax=Romanomermis culicivorax TaxID=13658 RepID=A0A915K3V5_ROMCU
MDKGPLAQFQLIKLVVFQSSQQKNCDHSLSCEKAFVGEEGSTCPGPALDFLSQKTPKNQGLPLYPPQNFGDAHVRLENCNTKETRLKKQLNDQTMSC